MKRLWSKHKDPQGPTLRAESFKALYEDTIHTHKTAVLYGNLRMHYDPVRQWKLHDFSLQILYKKLRAHYVINVL